MDIFRFKIASELVLLAKELVASSNYDYWYNDTPPVGSGWEKNNSGKGQYKYRRMKSGIDDNMDELEKELPGTHNEARVNSDCVTYERLMTKSNLTQPKMVEGLDKGHEKEWIGKNAYIAEHTMESIMKPGPCLILAPVKGEKRIREKVENDYEGDYTKICDSVRCSMAVDSFDEIPNIVRNLGKKVKLVHSKNRFKNDSNGYRDLLLNVQYDNGMVGEVQIHVKPMLIAKEFGEGHKLYERQREIESRWPKPKGNQTYEDVITDDGDKMSWLDLRRKQKELYDNAWKQATKGSGYGKRKKNG